uniref:DUF4062 domain-containing protein n=1 Tax=Pantanalinema rosaneae TaxID=1620701 RepID=UPI003D6FBC89
MNEAVARIFISSTFRDFGEERDLLVRQVFPALREKLRERFVELVDVDLRWGITAEQSERGEVLPICLAEIDRARPWFVGMLGDRYGWVPPVDHYDQALVDQLPWLAEHQGRKSVTELEILHGVLNDPAMAGRAFFYFRDPAYAATKGEDYISASPEDEQRLADLMDRIRASGFLWSRPILIRRRSRSSLKQTCGRRSMKPSRQRMCRTHLSGSSAVMPLTLHPGGSSISAARPISGSLTKPWSKEASGSWLAGSRAVEKARCWPTGWNDIAPRSQRIMCMPISLAPAAMRPIRSIWCGT